MLLHIALLIYFNSVSSVVIFTAREAVW